VDPELTRFLQRLNRATMEAFADAVEQSLLTAKQNHFRVLMVVSPICLACRGPLLSLHNEKLSPEAAERFAALLKKGREQWKAGQAQAAKETLQQAAQIDPEYAEARYLLGLALRQLGQTAEAKRDLEAAVEFDASAETIKEPPDRRLRSLAVKYQTRLFDLEDLLCRWLPDGIIDDRAMIDLTHLNLHAQKLFTDELAKTISEMGL